MQHFLYLVLEWVKDIFNLIDSVKFSFGGISVSLINLILSLFIICFVVSVFWKGAQR